MSKIGEGVLAEVKGASPARRRLDESEPVVESMPGWKLQSSEKSAVMRAFDAYEKVLPTLQFEDPDSPKMIKVMLKRARKYVSNPGWGTVLKDLYAVACEESIGRPDITSKEATHAWALYQEVMEHLVTLTMREVRKDGGWFVYDALNSKLKKMRQEGLSQAQVDDSFLEIEYPWTEHFSVEDRRELFKSAQQGFTEGMGIANDMLLKMRKKVKGR